ncbi:hypothetical protein [Leifsonia sp. Leaf264]|uniref:hypothetical protein n=1 Tax=Leifsonia sp. Leaf264 TaxID=1736314 RepID=UPI0006F30054|nr:hypothetical protein [Leifsonia sp. Leaf264]KQO98214.1 hypothetical protein ASF30_09135 [Leifsonia sp. Leaf264]
MTGDEAIAAVRVTGVPAPLVAYSLDEFADLGYRGWWSVVQDDDAVGGPIFVVSQIGQVHRFGSIPPWVQGLTTAHVLAGRRF